jgi:general secretion pathway protein H
MRADVRGFTLLELLLVLTIIVIAYAVAAPRMSGGVSGVELKSSARKVAAGLRQARNIAVGQRKEAVLQVDLDRRLFRLTGEEHDYALPEQVDLKLYTAQQELVGEKLGSIRFFPDGSSTGGRVTVAAGERKYDIDVDWLTGRVDISQ